MTEVRNEDCSGVGNFGGGDGFYIKLNKKNVVFLLQF